MRLLVALAFTALAVAQTPGTPVSSAIGSLSCGVRAYTSTQVQEWCYTGISPNLTLVHNAITTMQAGGGALATVFSYQESSGVVSSVSWFIGPAMAYQVIVGQCVPAATCTQGPIVRGTLPAATTQ